MSQRNPTVVLGMYQERELLNYAIAFKLKKAKE